MKTGSLYSEIPLEAPFSEPVSNDGLEGACHMFAAILSER